MLRRIRPPRADVPTSSMADIAFLLLVFFLVTTIFDEERGLRLVLPGPEEVPVRAENLLVFNVQENGLIELQRAATHHVQLIRASDIRSLWQREMERNPAAIAAVNTHPRARYRHMIDVLDALQSAGAERISLRLRE